MFIRKVKVILVVYWLFLIPFIYMLIRYQFAALLLSSISEIYEGYLMSDYYAHHNQPFLVILLILGLYIYIGIGLRREDEVEKNRLFLYGSAMSLVLVPLVRFDPSALRLISYFSVLLAIGVGNTSYSSNLMHKLFWVIVLIILLKAAISFDDGYRFMWQNKQLHERYGIMHSPLEGSQYDGMQKTVLLV